MWGRCTYKGKVSIMAVKEVEDHIAKICKICHNHIEVNES